MLDNCLVQGYANKGTTFGVYNNVKWGEAYKVFTRLAGLPFHEIPNSSHWSDKYRVAGESIGLWARTSTGKHPVNGTITLADIYTISNNLLHYYHKNQIEYNPSLKYGDAVKRGDFALFMEKVIRQVKQ